MKPCSLFWLALWFPAAVLARTPEQTPNLVFIMADDLGWKDTGFMGADFFETPHLDAMAEQGMTFTAGYSSGPNCAPTRGCLLSGTYTPRHEIYTPGGQSKGDPRYMRLLVPARERKDQALEEQAAQQFRIRNALAPEFVCIPEVLKQVGYTSARIGKWHLGPDTQGFDLSTANGKGGPGGSFYGNVDVAEAMTDRALQFIEDQQGGPFFLYLSHWDVHTPHRAREAVVARYQTKLDALPKKQRARFNPVYAGMIEAVDTSVGRVLAKLDELGLSEDTLVVFTSDNGGLPQVAQLAPLRGQKGSLFEAGVRVPLTMRWPGTIAAGSSCDTPVASIDFLPTFAALAGAPLPKGQPVDGTDVSPLMTGGEIEDRNLFWHYPLYLQGIGLDVDLPNGKTYSWRGFPSTSLRFKQWKLIEFHDSGKAALYNLKKDPGEQHDLSASQPRLAKKLHAELKAWQKETGAPVPSLPNPECVLPPLE